MKVLILISALVLMTACGKQVSKTNPKDTPKGNPGVVEPTEDGGFNLRSSSSERMKASKTRVKEFYKVGFPTSIKVEDGVGSVVITITDYEGSGREMCTYNQTTQNNTWISDNCNVDLVLVPGDNIEITGGYHKIVEATFLPR